MKLDDKAFAFVSKTRFAQKTIVHDAGHWVLVLPLVQLLARNRLEI